MIFPCERHVLAALPFPIHFNLRPRPPRTPSSRPAQRPPLTTADAVQPALLQLVVGLDDLLDPLQLPESRCVRAPSIRSALSPSASVRTANSKPSRPDRTVRDGVLPSSHPLPSDSSTALCRFESNRHIGVSLLSTFFPSTPPPKPPLSGLGPIHLASITALPIYQVFSSLFWLAILRNTCVNSSTCKFKQPRLRLFLTRRTPSFGLMSGLYARHLSACDSLSLPSDTEFRLSSFQISRSAPSPSIHAHLSVVFRGLRRRWNYPLPAVCPATRLYTFILTSFSPSSLWKLRKF